MAVPRRMASKYHLCLPKKGTHPFGRLDNSLKLRKSSHVTSSTKNRRASKSQSGVKGALGTFHGQQKSDPIGRSLSLILLEAAPAYELPWLTQGFCKLLPRNRKARKAICAGQWAF